MIMDLNTGGKVILWWHFLLLHPFSTFSNWAFNNCLYLLHCFPIHVVPHLNGWHYFLIICLRQKTGHCLGSSSLSSSTLTFYCISKLCLTFLPHISWILSFFFLPSILLLSWLRELTIEYFHIVYTVCFLLFYFITMQTHYKKKTQEIYAQ